jgi:hypothetical protein
LTRPPIPHYSGSSIDEFSSLSTQPTLLGQAKLDSTTGDNPAQAPCGPKCLPVPIAFVPSRSRRVLPVQCGRLFSGAWTQRSKQSPTIAERVVHGVSVVHCVTSPVGSIPVVSIESVGAGRAIVGGDWGATGGRLGGDWGQSIAPDGGSNQRAGAGAGAGVDGTDRWRCRSTRRAKIVPRRPRRPGGWPATGTFAGPETAWSGHVGRCVSATTGAERVRGLTYFPVRSFVRRGLPGRSIGAKGSFLRAGLGCAEDRFQRG